MNRACKTIVIVFAIAYAIALGLLIVGIFGLFGQERDPLSGVFLLPIGLPWIMLTDGVSDALKPWIAALAPGLNLVLIWLICRTINRTVS